MDRLFRIVAPILVVACIIYYGLYKYKWQHGTTPNLGGGGGGSRGSTLLSGNDQAMADKLEPFIHCINTTDSKLAEVAQGYHKMVVALKANPNAGQFDSTLDYETAGGFSQFERNDAYEVSCGSGIEKASAMSPKVADLDAIGPDYAATWRKLVPMLKPVELYYDQKDYKDDHMARGSQLDSQISPILDHLRQLSYGMRAGVERENNIIKKHELDAMAARDGKNLRWQTLNFMMESRATYEKVEELADSGKLDAANMEEAIQPVQTAFDAAQAYAAAHAQESRDEPEPAWRGISGSASSYLANLKDLRRGLENKATIRSLSHEIEDVEHSFNSMVDSYNQHRDMFP